ncbi:hypothetical protein LK537_27425 [Lachnoclostridium pacaense]|uniref:hypothetical protein n=1 Tax=Enterocloster hominis (ex Hitch et al. 2024) TaxID=1917870 RepID=UPI001D0FB5A4|nr:hypothetical protein [Lachnoclostridium pacaense]MCC2821031.1 hypothetical protein [Lachnoclostridium pacaense]
MIKRVKTAKLGLFNGGVNMWVVENVNGDGSLVKKEFETYQEAKAYAEWTFGAVRYVEN